MLLFGRCWVMIPLQHTQSRKSTCSIRSWQFAGLTAKRPPMCHHHSAWFMPSCLPQSHWAPCLISLPASGLERFILLPSLVIFFVILFSALLSFMVIIAFSYHIQQCGVFLFIFRHFGLFFGPFQVRLTNVGLTIFNLSSTLSLNGAVRWLIPLAWLH